jgi:hypothetical protein
MFRTDEDSAVDNLYVEGEPSVSPATVISAAAMNAIQEELCAPVEAAGLALDAADSGQLLTALAYLSDLPIARLALQNTQDKLAATGDDFLAFGIKNSGDAIAVGANGQIYKTTNGGLNWSVQSAAGAFTGNFRCAIWISSLSLYVIAGDTGEIQTSPDGVTWTQRTAGSAYSGNFKDAAFGAGVVVLIGSAGEIQSSANATAWTRRQTGGAGFVGLHFNGTVFVAGNGSGTYHSSNGTTWTSGGSEIVGTVAYGNGLWVGGDTGLIYTSVNGTSWTIFSITPLDSSSPGEDRIIYLGGRLWALLQPEPGSCFISDDPTKRWIDLGRRAHFTPGGTGPAFYNGRVFFNEDDVITASLYFSPNITV